MGDHPGGESGDIGEKDEDQVYCNIEVQHFSLQFMMSHSPSLSEAIEADLVLIVSNTSTCHKIGSSNTNETNLQYH